MRESAGWAELSGTVVKAANTRCAVPLVRDFARQHFNAHMAYDHCAIAVVELLAQLYDDLYSWPMFLSDAQVAKVKSTCDDIGLLMMRLRNFAMELQQLFWRITPKVHKLMHLHLYAAVMNPRWVQNYAEESLVGTTTRIWQRAMRGRYDNHAQSNVLLRRLVGLLLRIAG